VFELVFLTEFESTLLRVTAIDGKIVEVMDLTLDQLVEVDQSVMDELAVFAQAEMMDYNSTIIPPPSNAVH